MGALVRVQEGIPPEFISESKNKSEREACTRILSYVVAQVKHLANRFFNWIKQLCCFQSQSQKNELNIHSLPLKQLSQRIDRIVNTMLLVDPVKKENAKNSICRLYQTYEEKYGKDRICYSLVPSPMEMSPFDRTKNPGLLMSVFVITPIRNLLLKERIHLSLLSGAPPLWEGPIKNPLSLLNIPNDPATAKFDSLTESDPLRSLQESKDILLKNRHPSDYHRKIEDSTSMREQIDRIWSQQTDFTFYYNDTPDNLSFYTKGLHFCVIDTESRCISRHEEIFAS